MCNIVFLCLNFWNENLKNMNWKQRYDLQNFLVIFTKSKSFIIKRCSFTRNALLFSFLSEMIYGTYKISSLTLFLTFISFLTRRIWWFLHYEEIRFQQRISSSKTPKIHGGWANEIPRLLLSHPISIPNVWCKYSSFFTQGTHMWLMGCPNPCEMQESWDSTFLKVFTQGYIY